ncbi:cation diffusion facilitator family transporter [Youngiibacter multivorans]|uniref:Cation diffusion facilitator family transporter n=1 Tax=Youngiibacter multivorans TaxID=937251 RepID=A0ABS4G916_9CLOT|nr:cation diffusion facilitator family transporter [Youngiibacter multivorans]MBP1920780.1 cation diffusion facilitator family transporter [Youngiibacter multivorans]
MIDILINKIVDGKNYSNVFERAKIGIKAGIVGIVLNFILFLVKLLLGFVTGSISLMADAFNNLTDTTSSVVTILGFKLANRPPDEDHPYGHGRLEYLSGLTISVLVMFVGFQFIVSSWKKIVAPSPVISEWSTTFILVLSILLKYLMHLFYKRLGKKIGSQTLEATATDALGDVFTTSVVVLGLIASKFTTLPIDGVVGIAIALYIIYNGLMLTLETLNTIIGEKPDMELVEKIKAKVVSYNHIYAVHDLAIHSYGPGRTMASIHAEVPFDMNLVEIHNVVDKIERKVREELGVDLVIHIDPLNDHDDEFLAVQQKVTELSLSIPKILSVHDLRYTGLKDHKMLIFEAVVDSKNLTEKERLSIKHELTEMVSNEFPDTRVFITLDLDVTIL